jgi:hypothetical protein
MQQNGQGAKPMTKRIALLMAVVLYAASLTGCGCLRRVRGTLCPGAYCGSRTPILGSLRAPAPQPIVTAPPVAATPQFIQPQVIQPQVVAPQCVTCQPQCECVCPTTVCDPCCGAYQGACGCDSCGSCSSCGSCGGDCGCSSYSGYAGDAAYGGDCGCNAPFGINVAPGEYLGEVETNDSGWGTTQEPTDATNDPSPGI